MRLLIADDHPLVLDGLAALARQCPRMEVVATAQGGREAVELCLRHRPDVTVMDLGMADLDGVSAIREIRSTAPDAKVLVVTMRHGDEDVRRALEAGARGYLLKSARWPELAEAIEAVSRGLTRVSPEAAAALADSVMHSPLTAREREVLRALVRGGSNAEIAAALSVSEATVKVHITAILSKLGVDDRTKAMATALRRGLVHLG